MSQRATDIDGSGGPIAAVLGPGYEPRAEQVCMAEAVERCFADRSHVLVEAGTGVGKSFAYLVPALVRATALHESGGDGDEHDRAAGAVVQKDIPMLQAALGDGGACKAVLVKGRGNYVSIRRLKLASERQERLLPESRRRGGRWR
jgi:ATP-dependent DNA helicase DinG